MSELEPGHPDELLQLLTNWLSRANEGVGTLPPRTTPTEWAVRNFINTWRRPVRAGLDSVEASLNNALKALKAGDAHAAASEIESSLQTLAEAVRGELGLYEWNREET